ncbi:MAG: UDP-N-acetylmuramoyl-L-alanine--D-glutamate ligase [Patescibacteria group bacterium]
MKNLKLENLKNQKVGILGLGQENSALLEFLYKKGINVTVCDKKEKGEAGEHLEKIKNLPIQFRFGDNYLDNLEDFDVVFRTPGLPYLDSKISNALKAGVVVSSQIKLFFDLCPCPIVGVTGTKGKGTTTTLIYEILKKSSKFSGLNSRVFLGGNIGTPPIEFLDKLQVDDVVVLELSSFQLQDLEKSPNIAIALDIKVDHLDYHKDKKEYVEAKTNIVRFQTKDDFAVINADYLTSIELAAATPAQVYWFSRRKSVDKGTWVKNKEEIILRDNDKDNFICKTNELTLRGEHNLENVCAAVTASYLAGADITSIGDSVRSFKGLEHRLEFIREFNGISFYNDSFSTTPDTTIAAVKSFSAPIILLVGGSEKNANYEELSEVISSSSVKKIINIGSTGEKIIDLIKRPSINIVKDIKTMDEAINLALDSAESGDVVLLSPASASFDRYKNYKERGELFKKTVLSL